MVALRTAAWAALGDLLGPDEDDLSVEPPWRRVRRQAVPGIDGCETTVTLRDDGAECHLAWSAGLSAEVDDATADAVLVQLAADGERLLADVERGAAR